MLLLRDIGESDLQFTFQWHNNPTLAHQIMSYPPPIAWTEELKWFQRIQERSKNRDQIFRIVEYFGKPIGFVTLQSEVKTKTVEIGLLIGDFSLRGRGLGSEILRITLGLAKSFWKDHSVVLLVRNDNKRAISFYLKNSFEIIEEIEVIRHASKIRAVKMKLNHEEMV